MIFTKPTDSHCMNKFRNILTLCLIWLSIAASAQDYDRVYRRNPWNASGNVTGMRQDSLSRSYAELRGEFHAGQLRQTWEAPRTWEAVAKTASIRHLERMSLKGSFSFSQNEGYDMCGSMFIHPGFYPVDILEFTPGRKTLQTYAFDGGISYDLDECWRIGAGMDFRSQNLAKRKDLRHDNWRLDMRISPGLMFHRDGFAAGVNYIIGKNSETVDAEQVGTAESSYYAFLDKGLMYGVYSVWTGSGLHLDEDGTNGFPVKELENGIALQIQFGGLFAAASWINSQGTAGEKEYIWFRFPGNRLDHLLEYSWGEGGEHTARMNLQWSERRTMESILEKVTENGVTTVQNHGLNRIFSENTWALSPEYEYYTDRWFLRLKSDLCWEKEVSSQMYPFVCTGSMMTWSLHADARIRSGRLDFEPEFGVCGGRISEGRRSIDEDSGVETSPYRLEEWYRSRTDYITSPKSILGAALKYNFPKGIYVGTGATWMHGFGKGNMGGKDRIGAAIFTGYNF